MAEDVVPAARRSPAHRADRARKPRATTSASASSTRCSPRSPRRASRRSSSSSRDPTRRRRENWSKFEPTGSADREDAADRDAGLLRVQAADGTQARSPSCRARCRRRASSRATPARSASRCRSRRSPCSPTSRPGKHEEGDFTLFNAVDDRRLPDVRLRQHARRTAGSCPARRRTRAGSCCAARRSSSSLYTLKYVPGTNAVLTYLPPPADQAAPPTAVLVARNDVKDLPRPAAHPHADPEEHRPRREARRLARRSTG